MAMMPTDPTSSTYACDMAAFLREAYYTIVAGGSEKVIRYKGPNGEREVQFTSANLQFLQGELQYWEGLCGSPNPNRPRRFAIRGGSQRGRCWPWRYS